MAIQADPRRVRGRQAGRHLHLVEHVPVRRPDARGGVQRPQRQGVGLQRRVPAVADASPSARKTAALRPLRCPPSRCLDQKDAQAKTMGKVQNKSKNKRFCQNMNRRSPTLFGHTGRAASSRCSVTRSSSCATRRARWSRRWCRCRPAGSKRVAPQQLQLSRVFFPKNA